ncbi:MAG: hypothetical protein K0U41_03825, partial [Gammaproteobacteria bacterium]|nr:hypothetical protein [Gammaproteobacteria bacterium]
DADETFTFTTPFTGSNDDIIVLLQSNTADEKLSFAVTSKSLTGFTINRDDTLQGSLLFDYVAFNTAELGQVIQQGGGMALSNMQLSAINSILSLPDGRIPIKQGDELLDSGVRTMPNNELFFPQTVRFESNSIRFGDITRVSESNSFLSITNAQFSGTRFDLIDARRRRTSQSERPRQFFLTEAENNFIVQGDLDTEVTANPLIINYTATLTAQTNRLEFKNSQAMTNVRVRLSYADGAQQTIKYLPNEASWLDGTGGIDFAALTDTATEVNFIEFPDSTIRLFTDDNITIEVRADSINLLGSNTGFPYINSVIQRGEFRDLAYLQDVEQGNASTDAASVTQSSTNQNGLISGSLNVQEALDRIDTTGVGSQIIPFTGSFIARESNLNDWFRDRQNVTMEHTRGGSNQIRTFTLPDIDALNDMFDVLQARNVAQIFTITIGYLGGSTQFINRNALRIQAPNVSALFDRNEIPTTIAQGSSATFRISRVGGSIGQWDRIGIQETPSSQDTFGDLEFQRNGWNNADGSFLPSSSDVQKGYTFKVFGSNPNDGSIRAGLETLGVTDKVIYDDDWVVWTADSFTSWGNKDDWFVLAADDVYRISQSSANFLQHVRETDTRITVGLAQDNGASDALIWLSPEVMQEAPFLNPNTDSNNPRSNADGQRYVGGQYNVNNEGYFQVGSNLFNHYLYVGISPQYVIAQGAENIDIVVNDQSDEVHRFNLADDFTLIDDATFTNSTVSHYIYNTTNDPNSSTTFNYASLLEIGIILTRIDSTFGLDSTFDATPNVNDIQERQLSSDVRSLLERIKTFRQYQDFSSILDRISPYANITHSTPYFNARFATVPNTGLFGNISTMQAVSSVNPRFTSTTTATSLFIAVEGGQDRSYIVQNITQDTFVQLDASETTVNIIASQQYNGATYFVYRVDGFV